MHIMSKCSQWTHRHTQTYDRTDTELNLLLHSKNSRTKVLAVCRSIRSALWLWLLLLPFSLFLTIIFCHEHGYFNAECIVLTVRITIRNLSCYRVHRTSISVFSSLVLISMFLFVSVFFFRRVILFGSFAVWFTPFGDHLKSSHSFSSLSMICAIWLV